MSDRKPFSTGDAIALGSPTAGRMSGRARKAAMDRLRHELFDGISLVPVAPVPNQRDVLLRQARELRELAARGMKPRAFLKQAEKLEAQAADILDSRIENADAVTRF